MIWSTGKHRPAQPSPARWIEMRIDLEKIRLVLRSIFVARILAFEEQNDFGRQKTNARGCLQRNPLYGLDNRRITPIAPDAIGHIGEEDVEQGVFMVSVNLVTGQFKAHVKRPRIYFSLQIGGEFPAPLCQVLL